MENLKNLEAFKRLGIDAAPPSIGSQKYQIIFSTPGKIKSK